jgi:hypothetical protein
MAIILPLLLVIITSIMDFAFLLQSFEVVTNAAREGARVGVLPCYGQPEVTGRVNEYIASTGLSGTHTTAYSVTAVPGPGGVPWPAVQVAVTYTHQYLYLGPMLSLIGGSIGSRPFTSTSVMRLELNPPPAVPCP